MTFWIALALVLLHVVEGGWAVALLLGTAVFEISQTGFWLWHTTRQRAQVGAETMLGQVVEVAQECRPVGYVRVQGELWRARCDEGAESGVRVRVTGRDGLLLTVNRESAAG